MLNISFYNRLKFKIISATISILTVFLGVFFYFLYNFHREQLISSFQVSVTYLSSLVQNNLEYAMLMNRPLILHGMVEELARQDGVENIVILNKEGVIKVSSDKGVIGKIMNKQDATCQICHQLAPETRTKSIFLKDKQGGEFLRNISPILNREPCHECHDPKVKINGIILMDFSLADINRQLSSNLGKLFLLVVIMVGLLILVISSLMNRLVIKKLKLLEKTSKLIGEGKLEEKIEIPGKDEISHLADHFNRMTTNLKEIQRHLVQSEKLAATGQLAAGIAHELNNPIGNIMLYSKLLLEELEPGDIKYKNTQKIVDNTIRSKNIVSALLDYTRESESVMTSNNINDIAEKSLMMLRHHMEIQQIDVQLDTDPALPQVLCDKNQIQQVFINLIQNAIQSLHNGGKIEVFTHLGEDKESIIFGVKDNGPGIPKECLDKIFEPFYTTKEEGTGLGLSICYGIVERHKGKISVETQNSSPTEGKEFKTIFKVSLPITVRKS